MIRWAGLLAILVMAGPALAQSGTSAIAPFPATGLPGTGQSTPGFSGPATSGSAPTVRGGIVGYPGVGLGDNNPAAPAARGGLVPQTDIYTGTGLAPTPGTALPVMCPKEYGGRALAGSDVYDGPPMTGKLMVRRGGAWHLPPHDWPGNAYYLSCEYSIDRPPLPVRLPARIHECKRPLESTTQVVCR